MRQPCQRCEALPADLTEEGSLFISAPEAGTLGRIKAALAEAGLTSADSLPGLIEAAVKAGTLERLADALAARLSTNQLRDTKCLYLPPGETFSVQALFHMQPLLEFVYRARAKWLLEMLRGEGLVTHYQPIVGCQDPSQLFAYESLMRGRLGDGSVVSPGKILEYAKAGDLLFQVDRAARISAIRCAARHGIATNLFINFTPTSVYDPAFCLRTTVEAIQGTRLSPANIVFEVIESESIDDVEHVVRVLAFYRENGYRIALDDLGAGYSSLNLLTRLHPDFIKIDMGLIRDVHQDSYKGRIVGMLLKLARDLGSKSVAEGVESVEEWQWLKENGADYIQGYLFGKPSEVPQPPVLPA